MTVERKVWQECVDKKDGSLDHIHGEEGKLIPDWTERTHLSAPATWDGTLQIQTQNKITKCKE